MVTYRGVEQRERLTLIERAQGRWIGGRCHVDCRGNLDMALSLVEERMDDSRVSGEVRLAIESYITDLLRWWNSRDIGDPGEEPIAGEPEPNFAEVTA